MILFTKNVIVFLVIIMKLKSWMSKIDGKNEVLRLNIPGTHDCVTQFVQFSHISKCQNMNIYEQLYLGVRALDIRVESRAIGLKWCTVSQKHLIQKSLFKANGYGGRFGTLLPIS